MATKKTAPTEGGTPKTRTPKPVSAEAQALIDDANKQVAAAKSQIKEAKALGKIIGCIATLSDWGIAKVEQAIADRKATQTTQ